MKYAEEELIREEEINRKLEKRRSAMPLGKSKTPGKNKTKSMKSFDNGEITMKSRRLFNAPQSPSSQHNTEVMNKLNQDIRASLFGPEEQKESAKIYNPINKKSRSMSQHYQDIQLETDITTNIYGDGVNKKRGYGCLGAKRGQPTSSMKMQMLKLQAPDKDYGTESDEESGVEKQIDELQIDRQLSKHDNKTQKSTGGLAHSNGRGPENGFDIEKEGVDINNDSPANPDKDDEKDA